MRYEDFVYHEDGLPHSPSMSCKDVMGNGSKQPESIYRPSSYLILKRLSLAGISKSVKMMVRKLDRLINVVRTTLGHDNVSIQVLTYPLQKNKMVI